MALEQSTTEMAMQLLWRAVEIKNEAYIAGLDESFAKAIEIFGSVEIEFPGEKSVVAKALLHKAECLQQMRLYNEAISTLEQVIADFQNYNAEAVGLAYLMLGRIAVNWENNQPKAQQLYTEAIERIADPLQKEEAVSSKFISLLVVAKSEIDTRVRQAEDQIVQANIEHLKELLEYKSSRLGDRLDAIDQKILACRLYIEDYKRIYEDLDALNDRFSRLGAVSPTIYNRLPSTDIGDVIRQRIEHLRLQGRLR